MRAAAILLLAASPALAQAPEGPGGLGAARSQPAAADGRRPRHRRAAGDAGQAARRTRSCCSTARTSRPGRASKDGGAAPWKVENGYFEVVKGTGGIETKQALRRRPAPHRVDGARPAEGREPGPRQQRRLLRRRPLRDPGPRQLREQDLPGRPGGRPLRPVPAARERLPRRRASGRPTTSSTRRRASTRRASC